VFWEQTQIQNSNDLCCTLSVVIRVFCLPPSTPWTNVSSAAFVKLDKHVSWKVSVTCRKFLLSLSGLIHH